MQKCRLQKVEELTLKNSLTSGKKNDDVYKTIRKQPGPYSQILHCCKQI